MLHIPLPYYDSTAADEADESEEPSAAVAAVPAMRFLSIPR